MTSKIKITQEYFMKVVPEWYDPLILSGEGTLKEQICEYEKARVENDGVYVNDLLKGKTTVEFVEYNPSEAETLVTVTMQEVDRAEEAAIDNAELEIGEQLVEDAMYHDAVHSSD